MTQSNDMPPEIYVEGRVTATGYFQVDSWSKKGFPPHPLQGRLYAKYTRADVTPPQLPNRAVLDALIKSRDFIASPDFETATGRTLFINYLDQALSAATQADEVKVVDTDFLAAIEEVIRISDRKHWAWDVVKEHIKRQKGR